jgi:hypothetical protein
VVLVWEERQMDLFVVFGSLIALVVLAYFFGYDSRDGRRELW